MRKFFKILLKTIGILLLLAILTFGLCYALYNEPLPKGVQGAEADALAEKMLKAVNYEQYKKTRYLEWAFIDGKHQYKWDKENGRVDVSWSDYKVRLNLNATDKSLVYENNTEVVGNNRSKLIATALSYFNNDSFWLVAPFKVFDTGTARSIVSSEDGSERLLVSYSQGGSTPGDSYLWKLGDSGFPESFQMWVDIIPIGGLEASWDDWKVMENGLFLPASHAFGPMTLSIQKSAAYN